MNRLLYFFLLLTFSSCGLQKNKSIFNGGVFVSEIFLKDSSLNFDSVFPILAHRIDSKKEDTLYLKYRLGQEAIMDIDLVKKKECNCYISLTKIPFAPKGQIREVISLYILSDNKLKITFNESDSLHEFYYSLTYIDEVNLKTNRDMYFAEQGFRLFKE